MTINFKTPEIKELARLLVMGVKLDELEIL